MRVVLLLAALAAAPASAQDPAASAPDPAPAAAGATPLSIEDALSRAVGASESVDVAVAAVDRAKGQRLQALSTALPQLFLTAGYSHTFKSEYDRLFSTPTTVTPTPTGATGTPTGTTPTGTGTTTGTTGTTGVTGDPSGGSVGSSPFADLPFGKPNTYRVTFTVNQAIYGGGRIGPALNIAAIGRRSADLGVESAKAAAALDTARAYYDAALAQRLVEIAEQTLQQATRTYDETKLAFEVQSKPEFEVLRARVQLDNQRVAQIRQERLREAAFVHLAQILDLPADTTFSLTSSLDVEQPADVSPTAVQAVGTEPAGDRVAVQQASQYVEISEKTLAITRSQYLPTLGATASYGWTSYPDSVLFTLNGDDWYPSVSAGLNLTVPLFQGERVRGEVMSAQADLAQARVQADQIGEAAEADARDAAAELRSAEAQWESTATTVEQAHRAYDIAELRFREGVSTQTELADAQLLLETALANRAQAARDLQVARVRNALLPLLPVPSGAAR